MLWHLEDGAEPGRADPIVRQQAKKLIRGVRQRLDRIGRFEMKLHFNQKLPEVKRQEDVMRAILPPIFADEGVPELFDECSVPKECNVSSVSRTSA